MALRLPTLDRWTFGSRSIPSWAASLCLAVAAAAFGYYVLLLLQRTLVLAAYPFDVDQGESYDVWAAWLLLHGQQMYSSAEHWPFFTTNYPPVYFALLAPLLQWFGLGLGVGRILAAVATLLTAIMVGIAAAEYARSRVAGAFAGLLFLTSTYVFHVGALARVNTWMALLALAAVYCASKSGRLRLGGAVALCLLAAFTKPTALDALAAAVLFLGLTRRPREAALCASLAAVLGGIGVAALELATGRAFLLNVVSGNANPWDVWQASSYAFNFIGVHHVVVLLALGTLWIRRSEAISIYPVFLLSAGLVSLGAGKAGAGESYFLETLAALCVVAAPAIAALFRSPLPLPRLALGLALTWQAVIYAHGAALDPLPVLRDRGFQAHALAANPAAADREAADQLVREFVLKWDGPVLAEDAGFALVAGKEVIGNPTHLRNLFDVGRWRPDELVSAVDRQRFDFVILNAQLYPPPVLAAIGRHYYLYATVRVNGYNYQVFAPGAT